jgi:hypothetical protein
VRRARGGRRRAGGRDRRRARPEGLNGRVVRGYTEEEIDGCDAKKERCSLVYSNGEQVIDKRRSNWGTPRYRKVLKAKGTGGAGAGASRV